MADLFDFGERLGLFLIVEVASLSAIATGALLLYILYGLFTRRQDSRAGGHGPTGGPSTDTESIDNEPQDVSGSTYFRNLMVAELIQAIGGLLNIQWIIDASVADGTLCTAQGVMKQMGDVGVALTTLTIATHTFLVLGLRWHPPTRILSIPVPFIVVSLIWTFIVLAIAIPAGLHQTSDAPYYSNTGYWCWISETYSRERIGLEYFWLWAAAFIQVAIYVFLALVFRGMIVIEKGRFGWQSVKTSQLDRHDDDYYKAINNEEAKATNGRAMQMLFYPLVYIITVFPVSIVRWLDFSGSSVPPGATIFAGILFSSSGFLNVLLYSITRPGVVKGSPTSIPDTEQAHKLNNVAFPQQTSPHSTTATSVSASHAERRRAGSVRSANGTTPFSPAQRKFGVLPDLGDEDEEQMELSSAIGRTYGHPQGASHSSSARPGTGDSFFSGRTATEPPSRTRAQNDDDMGRLPDSDDER
ncbi:hypothetical protein EYR40_010920 [Pleurotus pulmonarius]|nr:hypothetical protein EYR36_002687 [Pleurotus pulmonarius]KAF4586903.1 hypothetical protein EYR40_010920 [Pleurotus pulmonarius]